MGTKKAKKRLNNQIVNGILTKAQESAAKAALREKMSRALEDQINRAAERLVTTWLKNNLPAAEKSIHKDLERRIVKRALQNFKKAKVMINVDYW